MHFPIFFFFFSFFNEKLIKHIILSRNDFFLVFWWNKEIFYFNTGLRKKRQFFILVLRKIRKVSPFLRETARTRLYYGEFRQGDATISLLLCYRLSPATVRTSLLQPHEFWLCGYEAMGKRSIRAVARTEMGGFRSNRFVENGFTTNRFNSVWVTSKTGLNRVITRANFLKMG